MQIIKEVCTIDKNQKCVIRNNTYGSSLELLNSLFQKAKEDFPKLEENEVNVVQYGGQRYKGTFGIEFDAPDKVPDSYQNIQNLEYKIG